MSIILLSPLPILWCMWIFSRPVRISYRISEWSWIGVNVAVYTYSLVLMLVCTGVMLKNEMFFNELGKVFVQQGGGVIFVIFFSNILNMLLIRANDLDYLRGYSPTLSKLHFSAICLSCAWVCYRIGTYTSYLIGHNSFYG